MHAILGKLLEVSHNTLTSRHQFTLSHILCLHHLSKFRKPAHIFFYLSYYSHPNSPELVLFIKFTFTEDQETKMSQASDLTNQTPSATRVTLSKAKDGSSKVVTDAVPISVVPNRNPIKKKTKIKSPCVSVSETAFVSPSIPISKSKEDNPINIMHVVKKLHTMTSLYIDPIKIQNVSHNVTTFTCDPIVTKINVETPGKPNSESRSPAHPRFAKNVSQEITTQNQIGIYVYESPSKTMVDDLIPNVSKTVDDTSVETLKEILIRSDVTPGFITSVLQFDAPIVASHDNPSKEPESKSVPEGEKSQ